MDKADCLRFQAMRSGARLTDAAQREFLNRQTAMRLRPLARRRLSTLRPPSVLMRDRNPCTFLRRRLWGWKVRFIDQPFRKEPRPKERNEAQ